MNLANSIEFTMLEEALKCCSPSPQADATIKTFKVKFVTSPELCEAKST